MNFIEFLEKKSQTFYEYPEKRLFQRFLTKKESHGLFEFKIFYRALLNILKKETIFI